MNHEDIATMQEELEATRAEVERLQVTAADAEAQAAHLESQLAETRTELELARGEAEGRAKELDEAGERSQALEEQVRAAAERYRALALEHAPDLPEELVAGETVEQIEAALERARETVSKVRGRIESQAQAGRVPVGSPARSEPELGGLSTEQKIRYGLDHRPAD